MPVDALFLLYPLQREEFPARQLGRYSDEVVRKTTSSTPPPTLQHQPEIEPLEVSLQPSISTTPSPKKRKASELEIGTSIEANEEQSRPSHKRGRFEVAHGSVPHATHVEHLGSGQSPSAPHNGSRSSSVPGSSSYFTPPSSPSQDEHRLKYHNIAQREDTLARTEPSSNGFAFSPALSGAISGSSLSGLQDLVALGVVGHNHPSSVRQSPSTISGVILNGFHLPPLGLTHCTAEYAPSPPAAISTGALPSIWDVFSPSALPHRCAVPSPGWNAHTDTAWNHPIPRLYLPCSPSAFGQFEDGGLPSPYLPSSPGAFDQFLGGDIPDLLLPPPLINQLEDDLIPRSPYILAPLLANPPPASEVRLAPYGDLVACGILPGPARTAT
ncbi:hypothetical protein HETIRDRAFT_424524 [Heterobasidion irregulare TC 32-1]|uniref:Uncharacterized protein n=1 Tax=Heterobasidion irregulare (strain TC 32-1) TaxID=747525 RepID=W4KJ17_HETIT|nr:uncharacterized protein HETIRDRAFT_424524 [Heterobasidion irregulare TC 32-1]ETW85066.1 hypothetical protein HETIRDRAFT_424524 [Heterobasidion irregulare TC 32-1]